MRVVPTALAAAALAASTLLAAPAAQANGEQPCVLLPDTKLTDLTIDELNRYELRNGEPIPTLEQFLDLANSAGVGVLPEIKYFGDPKPPLNPAQLQQYRDMMNARTNIPEKIIGSFDPPLLQWFKDNEPTWPRIWFRGAGGADPLAPPTVAEMRQRAPAADVLGLINVGYFKGVFPLNGQTYDVPKDFADAGIPVYIWYNVISGGDSPQDGEKIFGIIPSPGWNSIASATPKNVTWIATDFTAQYKAWSLKAPEAAKPVPQMVAHRGGGLDSYSENSLSAFQQAINDGAAVLETDIQWTKPRQGEAVGVPVLMHDETINRTVRCKPSEAVYVPMATQRALDTRTGVGPLGGTKKATVDLSSMVPAGATAITYNLTATGQTASGFAAVKPLGAADGSSVLNWTGANQTIANAYVVQVNADRKLEVSVGGSGTAQVTLDVMGYFTPTAPTGSVFTPVMPTRIYDSRDGDGPLAAGSTLTLNINEVVPMAMTPATKAASLNVTLTGTNGTGYVNVAKAASTATSTVNWSGPGQTIANAVVSEVADDGTFTISAGPNNGPTEVVVDYMGYFASPDETPAGGYFYAIPPTRSYDSRISGGPLSNTRSRVNAQPIPSSASAIALNSTLTATVGSGYFSVTPPEDLMPRTSLVNWSMSGTTRANGGVLGTLGANTRATVGGFGTTQYVYDVGGYFQPRDN